jgi:hypothetical protein
MKSQRLPALFVFVALSVPLLVASADPSPADSASPAASASASAKAGPRKDPISAAIFAGTTKAPSEEAWKKDAVAVDGVRMSADAERHRCYVKHIAEWVRIECPEMDTARVDILAGEKRDFSVIGSSEGWNGENMQVQFSMRPGDRRVIQWVMADLWSEVWPGDNGEWMSGIPNSLGPMLGASVQVDWASGSEPMIWVY